MKIGIDDQETSLIGFVNADIFLESRAYALRVMQSGSTL